MGVGLGALELLQPGIAAKATQWLTSMAMKTDRAMAQRLVALLSGLNEKRLEVLGVTAFLFAALFTVEGVGLWRGMRWAEYLTVVATASFVPFEVYELTRQVNVASAGGLVLNLVVVAYLIYRLKHPTGRP